MDLKNVTSASAPPRFSRRRFLETLPVLALPAALHAASGSEGHVVFGATGKKNPGIHLAQWNSITGELGPIRLAFAMEAPSFFAVSSLGGLKLLYAVNEGSGPRAVIQSFTVENNGASLQPLNTQPSGGDGPTHISASPDGHMVAVANYGGGSISTFRTTGNGQLSEAVAHIQFTGHGLDADRQSSPHPHSVRFTPDGRFLVVNDLGLDRISIYRVDEPSGDLTPCDPPFWQATAGSGPRHIAFHPNGRWIYSVNEMNATVDILRWDEARGRVTQAGRVSTAPQGSAAGAVLPGEIAISADGQSLYVGNRVGSETIAVFSVENAGASLKLQQLASNGGKNTRHLVLDPSGRWLLLSNVGSGEVVVLARDRKTGRLSEPRHRYVLDGAMCAAFV